MIKKSGISHDDKIIALGGGASTRADNLLFLGHKKISVLDISLNAINLAKIRLKQQSDLIKWIVADITSFTPYDSYSLWHDRAVFHFLTTLKDQQKYVATLQRSLNQDGTVIIAAFAPDGPSMCSGLNIRKYDSDSLSRVLGNNFTLKEEIAETHITPKRIRQQFNYYRFIYTG